MFDYLALLKDKDNCLSSKRISLLVLVLITPPILYWVIEYLMILGKVDAIVDVVKTFLWVTASLGGAVASERFGK